MPYLAETLLFLAPFAIFLAWRRLYPGAVPRAVTLWLALAGLACGLAGAAWYGFSVRSGAHVPYQPAELGPNGEVVRGHAPP
jgi:hypothetical protein